MRKEIELLGAFHIALSILYIFISAAIFAVLLTKGFFYNSEIRSTQSYMICAVIGTFFLIFALCDIIAAAGVMRKKPWSEMLMLILGCLNLVLVPLGTALGIYTIHIIMHGDKSVSESISKDNILKKPDTGQVDLKGLGAFFQNNKDPV